MVDKFRYFVLGSIEGLVRSSRLNNDSYQNVPDPYRSQLIVPKKEFIFAFVISNKNENIMIFILPKL